MRLRRKLVSRHLWNLKWRETRRSQSPVRRLNSSRGPRTPFCNSLQHCRAKFTAQCFQSLPCCAHSPKMDLTHELAGHTVEALRSDSQTLIQVQVFLASRAWVGRNWVHLCEAMRVSRRRLFPSSTSSLYPTLWKCVKTPYSTWPSDASGVSTVSQVVRAVRSACHRSVRTVDHLEVVIPSTSFGLGALQNRLGEKLKGCMI